MTANKIVHSRSSHTDYQHKLSIMSILCLINISTTSLSFQEITFFSSVHMYCVSKFESALEALRSSFPVVGHVRHFSQQSVIGLVNHKLFNNIPKNRKKILCINPIPVFNDDFRCTVFSLNVIMFHRHVKMLFRDQ